MGTITGRVIITVDGEKLTSKTGATLNGLGISSSPALELTTVLGDTNLGVVEKAIVASLEVTVVDRDDVDLTAIARTRGGVVTVQEATATGKKYTLIDANCMLNFTLTTGEGDTTLRFEGTRWDEDK